MTHDVYSLIRHPDLLILFDCIGRLLLYLDEGLGILGLAPLNSSCFTSLAARNTVSRLSTGSNIVGASSRRGSEPYE